MKNETENICSRSKMQHFIWDSKCSFFLVEEGEEKKYMHSLSQDFLISRDRKWNRFWKIQQGFKISMILWSLRAWITQVLKLTSCYFFCECDTVEKTWIWIFPASPGSYLCDLYFIPLALCTKPLGACRFDLFLSTSLHNSDYGFS